MSSAREILDETVTEAGLLRAIVRFAGLHGWRWFHCPDAALAELAKSERWDAMPAPGYPDLTLARGGRLIFAELKSAKGKIRDDQAGWLAELEEVRHERGIEVYVWRPRDWSSGKIEEVLR